MKTIKQVFDEFLEEQQVRLKPRTYGGYEDAIYLFEQCLNSYAYQYLDDKDSKLFDKLYNEKNKEFCELFGPDKIGSSEIGEFLDYFMIRKVMGSEELMKTVGRVMRKFVKWMNEKGYMNEGEYDNSAEIVDELKDELPKVVELSSLIYEYIEDNPPEDFSESVDGYFRVIKIEPRKLWLEDYIACGGTLGPVSVSTEISSMCKEGWVIYLELGKTSKGWQMLVSGTVYPK
ncbi:hypothetical protein C5S29_12180 [ANME-1 cluster archaeon GoMg3.2]|nr:hypothetical protein [ANME-1 cluster archaeon GoMg3.2]